MALPDVTLRLVNQHFINYSPYKPKDDELEAMLDWGDGLDESILKHVLSFENHPANKDGHRARPNFADLKSMANDSRRERGDFRRQEAQSLLDGEDCFYCDDGFVFAAVTRQGLWHVVVTGLCGHCNAMSGGSAWYKVVEPHPRIVELAREWEITCPEAVNRVVENHWKKLPKKPAQGNIVDALPEYLKGLPEHEGTDAEGTPF